MTPSDHRAALAKLGTLAALTPPTIMTLLLSARAWTAAACNFAAIGGRAAKAAGVSSRTCCPLRPRSLSATYLNSNNRSSAGTSRRSRRRIRLRSI